MRDMPGDEKNPKDEMVRNTGSGGPEGPAEELDAEEFDHLLTRAVATPPLDPQVRNRLRRRMLELHPRTERMHVSERMSREMGACRGTQTPSKGTGPRRRRAPRRRGGFLNPAMLVATAAVILMVVLVPRLSLEVGPIAEFGRLPGIAVAPLPNNGGAGGPGFSFEFSYRLGAPLTTGWPSLPKREHAYRLQPHRHTEQAVGQLAANLGISAPVTREGWHDTHLLVAGGDHEGPSIMVFPDGYTYFSQPYDFRPLTRGELPSDARAVEVARSWLVASGLVPAGELGAETVYADDLGSGFLVVTMRPQQPGDVVTIAPLAVVQIGANEHIVAGSATWFPAEASSRYPLRDVGEAWREVESGHGILEWAIREYPGPAGDDNLITGEATVTQVRVAWALAFTADRTPYLVPIYAFSGTVVVPSLEGPATLPFQVWAPAVTNEYSG